MLLVGFIMGIYHDARSSECQIQSHCFHLQHSPIVLSDDSTQYTVRYELDCVCVMLSSFVLSTVHMVS